MVDRRRGNPNLINHENNEIAANHKNMKFGFIHCMVLCTKMFV